VDPPLPARSPCRPVVQPDLQAEVPLTCVLSPRGEEKPFSTPPPPAGSPRQASAWATRPTKNPSTRTRVLDFLVFGINWMAHIESVFHISRRAFNCLHRPPEEGSGLAKLTNPPESPFAKGGFQDERKTRYALHKQRSYPFNH
jgi:hypothetical protein